MRSARLMLRARNSVAVTLRPGPGGVTDGLMLATSNSGFVPSGSPVSVAGGGGSTQAVVAVARFNGSGRGFVS
jgi:hypothetical protein